MKTVRLMAGAAVLALAIVALAGVGSASATVLCNENVGENECPASKIVSLPTTIKGNAETLTFSSGGLESTCSGSDMELIVEKNLGANKGMSGKLSLSSFVKGCNSYCLSGEFGAGPYNAEISESAGNGVLNVTNGGSGNPRLTLKECGPSHTSTCRYETSKLTMQLEGASFPAHIKASKAGLAYVEGPLLCPSEWQLSTDYQVTNPGFTATSSNFSLANASNETLTTCTNTSMSSTPGSLTAFTLSGCGGMCTGAEASGLPNPTQTYTTDGKKGTVSITSPALKYTGCLLGGACTYGASSLVLDISGGELVASKEPVSLISGKYCPVSTLLNANFGMTWGRLAVAAKP